MKNSPSGITLSVRDLGVTLRSRSGALSLVRNVSFDIARGEIFAIIGESGSGKTTTAQAIMGLLPKHLEVTGEVLLGGTDLLALPPRERRALLGKRIGFVSQDALSALNPCTTVGYQIAEVMMVHRKTPKREAMQRAVELLRLTGVSAPEQRVNHYPHQFSGGMRQRALIAMALALDPELLIADEPTTALDATVKAQINELLLSLRDRFGMSVLLITHDMGTVAKLADRLLVMYAGQCVEQGQVEDTFAQPLHPYARLLLKSIPRLDQPKQLLSSIPGAPPPPGGLPAGCPFEPRCDRADARCKASAPVLRRFPGDRQAACHHCEMEAQP